MGFKYPLKASSGRERMWNLGGFSYVPSAPTTWPHCLLRSSPSSGSSHHCSLLALDIRNKPLGSQPCGGSDESFLSSHALWLFVAWCLASVFHILLNRSPRIASAEKGGEITHHKECCELMCCLQGNVCETSF